MFVCVGEGKSLAIHNLENDHWQELDLGYVPYEILLSQDNKTAFVATHAQGLSIVNLHDPSDPQLIGTFLQVVLCHLAGSPSLRMEVLFAWLWNQKAFKLLM